MGFAAAWLLVAFVVFPDEGPPDAVLVPAVVGLPYADASQRLTTAGLKASQGESRLSGEAPKSTVLAQTPVAGSRAQRGDPVTLDVSAGQQRATIPELVGKGRSSADRILREAGLTMGQVTERADAQARGTVLALAPSPGQVVPAGTAVDLVVSSGPAQLTMPDLVGRDLIDARSTIEQLGLTIGAVRYDSSSTRSAGRVLEQFPTAGTSVAPGAAVTLLVSGTS